jgi:membrane protein insertase Oxa1/YidC/SpoIIIJ
MMLFFFYTMPSGLVLYWTISQVIAIAQMLIKKPKTV